jgi:hypothetical protein
MDYFAKLNTPKEKWDVHECENCGSVVRTGRLLLHHYSQMHKGSPEFKSKCLFSKNCYHHHSAKIVIIKSISKVTMHCTNI